MNNTVNTLAKLFYKPVGTIQKWRRNGLLKGYSSKDVYEMVNRDLLTDMVNQVLWEQIKEEAERSLERKVYEYTYKGRLPTKTMDPKRVTSWYEELGFVWSLVEDGVPEEPIIKCHIKFDITVDQAYNRPVSDLVGPLIYALRYGDIIKTVGSRCVLRTIITSQKCEKGMDIARVEVEEIF